MKTMAYSTKVDIEYQLEADVINELADDTVDLATTTLASSLAVAATSVTLTDSSKFPSSGIIRIGSEYISYTANAANILSGLTRGIQDTVDQLHAIASAVYESLSASSDIVSRAIENADATINRYCGKVVSVLPFDPVPTDIRQLSVDLAIYNLFSRRGKPTENDIRVYDNAIKTLEKIAKGLISFGADEDNVTREDIIAVSTHQADQLFTIGSTTDGTTGTLDNFIIKI